MSIPPTSSLFDQPTCYPSWLAHYLRFSRTPPVASGCNVDATTGNVPCDPEDMARKAAQLTGLPVDLATYTLARYIESEVGTGTIGNAVAVGQDAINRATYVENLDGNVVSLLLNRQSTTGVWKANRGYYGPIHGCAKPGEDKYKGCYGRWAATTKDPSPRALRIAIDLLNGTIPDDYNRGADNQNSPGAYVKGHSVDYAVKNVANEGANHTYWVGPIPGVNHMDTMQYRTIPGISPSSTLGQHLINRAVAAVKAGAPDWSSTPGCGGGQPQIAMDAETGLDFGSKGVLATIAGVLLIATSVVVGTVAWRRSRA